MEPEIVPADAADAWRLHDILVHAKAHWGYDLAWVREWAGNYDFARLFATHDVFVAQVDGDVVAWAALIPSEWAVATCASRSATGGDRCR